MKPHPALVVLRSCAFAALFAWISVVSVKRIGALAAGRPAFDAVGETRWMQWAYRDPLLLESLGQAQRKLKPGDAVLAVCTSAPDAFWYLAMTQYGLPQQVVVGAKAEGTPGRVFPTRLRMAGGGAELLPRSGGGAADGAR